MTLWKKATAMALAAMMSVSLSACQGSKLLPFPIKSSSGQQFDNFIEQEFISTMESDYTNCHVFLQDPAAFGVDKSKIPVNLGVRLDEDSQAQAAQQAQDAYEQFLQFDRNTLSAEQQDTYDIYQFQTGLSLALSDEKFDYYGQLFASMSGLHYQLPTLFADWQVRSEQDVKDLILLVQDVPAYVDSALEYTKQQADRGLLMVDFDEVISYCNSVLESGENSAVLASMCSNIDALGLNDAAASEYKAQLREAFVSCFLPSYENILAVMQQLQTAGVNNEQGLAHFEHGQEYYELLLQSSVGSNKTVEEVRTMMQNAYSEHLTRMQAIIMENPSVLNDFLGKELGTGYTSYEAILDDIQSKMFQDFPAVNQLDYDIFDINEEIASTSGVAAYFNIPPLDGSSVKQLRVNPLTGDVGTLSIYSTVAHEGFPGHMYQYAYMYENLSSPWRKALANSNAYTEGYAVYAQYAALDYLQEIDPALLELYKENELISYCAIILADIGIHYDGWSVAEFSEFLEDCGFSMDEQSFQKQYAQLQANPCTFQPYYVGYHEFAAMETAARQQLGDSFSPLEFHKAILETGTAPFSVVQQHVDDYVQRTLSQAQAA